MSNNKEILIEINENELSNLGFTQKGTTCFWEHPLLPFNLGYHPRWKCSISGTRIELKYTSDIQFLLDLHNPPTKAPSHFEAVMNCIMLEADLTREIIENHESVYTLIEMSITNGGAFFNLSFYDDNNMPEIDPDEHNGYDFVANTNELIDYIIKPK